MTDRHTVTMEKRKLVDVRFEIPSDWDAEDFIAVLMGCYDDMEGRENAEQVGLVLLNTESKWV